MSTNKKKDNQEQEYQPMSLGKNGAENSFVPMGDEVAPPPVPMDTSNSKVAKVNEPTAKAVAQNPTVSLAMPKSPTLSDLLAKQREDAVKDKTDAVKMQKYYALTDALGALGKMGGVAIGGAIGGNVLDSAPAVAEYQPSKGYVTAFEEANKATERLRALDDKTYQLALRDEDRKYTQQQKKLDRDWQKKMADYQNQIAKANADRDFERSSQLQKELLKAKQAHEAEVLRVKGQQEKELMALRAKLTAAEGEKSRANMKYQYDLYNSVPIAFNDGTARKVTKSEYAGMLDFFNGKEIGGKTINKDNFSTFLRENPKLVNDYLSLFAEVPSETDTKTAKATDASKAEYPADVEFPYPFQNQNFMMMPDDVAQSYATNNTESAKADNKPYSVDTDPMAAFLSKK